MLEFLSSIPLLIIILAIVYITIYVNLIIAIFKIRNNTADTADLLEEINKKLDKITSNNKAD